MAVFSKQGSCWDTDPKNLCRAVIGVYSGHVALRNVAQLCKVPTRAVRELVDVIHQKQKVLMECCKERLIESVERAQITRLIGNYLSCAKLASAYTDWELHRAIHARFFGTGRSIRDLVETYGIPERTISRHVRKIVKRLKFTTLKELQCGMRDGGVSRERIKETIQDLLSTKKRGRPTLLTRDEEALMVAKAELEAVHGFPVNRRELGHRLNNLVGDLCSANNKQRPDMQDKSKKQFARRVVRRVNMLEPGMEGQKKKSKTGEIKVAGLSHKRAKQSDPRLAWIMFHKICRMCRDVRTMEQQHREALAKKRTGLDLLTSVVEQLNAATPTAPVPPQAPLPPPQAPVPPPQAPVRTKYEITDEEAKKSLEALRTVPKDLQDLQPRSSQVWNCDEIGIDPTGKWVKIVCTWKWCMSEKIWKCKDGEHAPFWVTVLFFTRADGQCFLPPCIVHKGVDYSCDFNWKIPDDWIVHATPSGYMDRDGWFKVINMFTQLSGAQAGNIQILYYDGHDSHWDADAMDLMAANHVQPFVLKAGDSENDQPNDNGPNAKLKACYNERKHEWTRKFLSTPYSPAHMNSVLVKTWDDFKVDSAGIIRRSFDKTKLCPLQTPSADTKYLGNACISSLQCGTGKKSKELESMVSDVYAPAKLLAKRTCDEHVILQCRKNWSRNIIIRSAAYDAVYQSVVVPAQELKNMQQDIDNQKKIKITKQMNPLDTRMNQDSSSGIYVCGEARAQARIVQDNRKKALEKKLATKAATEK